MRAFLLKIGESLLVVWAVVSIAFFALRLGRIDPVAELLAHGSISVDQAHLLRNSLGLDQPLAIQYLNTLAGLARGDWGRSIFSGEEVAPMLGAALSFTAPLALVSWLAAVAFGIAFGSAASHRGEAGLTGRLGECISPMLSAGAAIPVALTGLMILWSALPLLSEMPDTSGREILRFACAVLVLALNVGCAIGRAAESSIRRTRREPFYLAMRAQGMLAGRRLDGRLLRASIAPVLSLAAMEAGFLLGGTMIVETVFARAGLGRLAVDAILRGDFPVVQAALMLGAVGYCLCVMLADGLAILLDPRLRGER
jgi:peptide/nickel transport system permease protein